jgi:hypothetical protein
LTEVLHWPSIPVNAALFPASRADSLAIPRGSFRLTVCETCGFLFNADHDDAAAEYSARCIETQAHSAHHRAFAEALARGWVERHGLRDARVVEVGCGHDADFLRILLAEGVAHGTCIDPACSLTDTNRLTVLPERFSARHAGLAGRALVCRHTLEHIAGTHAFLADVRLWASENSGAATLFEVPDAGRIMDQGAFWDVYYEHCSYFTDTTLATAFRAAGLEPTRIEHVYGDQYLVLEAVPGERAAPDPDAAAPVVRAALDFGRAAETRIRQAARSLEQLHDDGPVVLWQAGGKALSLLTLTGAEALVPGVVDANPAKRGCFLPGSEVEILAPEDLMALRPRHVVVMNEVYLDEIATTLSQLGVDASLRAIEALF